MTLVYAITGWALMALGLVHMAATPRYYARHGDAALWFFSGGALIALIAALNLLNRAYGRSAPGLRAVCVVANVVLLAQFVVGGFLTHSTAVVFATVLLVMGTLSALSASRRALR